MATLEEVIEKAKRDPETKEHGAVVYFHRDYRFKVDTEVLKIMPEHD